MPIHFGIRYRRATGDVATELDFRSKSHVFFAINTRLISLTLTLSDKTIQRSFLNKYFSYFVQ